MGNQLTFSAPSRIFPVEHYLLDVPWLNYHSSLGSTRFMKVARATCQAGPLVVKVFVLNTVNHAQLEQYRVRLECIRSALASVPGCLPFARVVITAKCVVLVRQHIRYSVYDRLATRPYLTHAEKCFIVFQLLAIMAASHSCGIQHGDLKVENLLVTSHLYLQVVDWASYKPVLLSVDDPSDYNFFFDTSRRRLCYIAPERFCRSAPVPNPTTAETVADAAPATQTLTAAMDMFSVGCCIGEMFGDGVPLFDLPQLLALAQRSLDVATHVHKRLRDAPPLIVQMVASLLHPEPERRPSARDCLHAYCPSLFCPTYGARLYARVCNPRVPDICVIVTQLVPYVCDRLLGDRATEERGAGSRDHDQDVSQTPRSDCAVVVLNCLLTCVRTFSRSETGAQFGEQKFDDTELHWRLPELSRSDGSDGGARAAQTALCTRSPTTIALFLLNSIYRLSRHMVTRAAKSNDICLVSVVVDRVLPYLLSLCTCQRYCVRVRARSLLFLVRLLSVLSGLPTDNPLGNHQDYCVAPLFMHPLLSVDLLRDYIMKKLDVLLDDSSALVRVCYATVLSQFSHTFSHAIDLFYSSRSTQAPNGITQQSQQHRPALDGAALPVTVSAHATATQCENSASSCPHEQLEAASFLSDTPARASLDLCPLTEHRVDIASERRHARHELIQVHAQCITQVRAHVLRQTQALLFDRCAHVRIALLHDVGRLSAFFGRKASCELLLSHLIAMLNDLQGALWLVTDSDTTRSGAAAGAVTSSVTCTSLVRCAFFGRALRDLIAHIGECSVQLLLPLITQALHDRQPCVTRAVLAILHALALLCTHTRALHTALDTHTLGALLVHPCVWLRYGTVLLVCACAGAGAGAGSGAATLCSSSSWLHVCARVLPRLTAPDCWPVPDQTSECDTTSRVASDSGAHTQRRDRIGVLHHALLALTDPRLLASALVDPHIDECVYEALVRLSKRHLAALVDTLQSEREHRTHLVSTWAPTQQQQWPEVAELRLHTVVGLDAAVRSILKRLGHIDAPREQVEDQLLLLAMFVLRFGSADLAPSGDENRKNVTKSLHVSANCSGQCVTSLSAVSAAGTGLPTLTASRGRNFSDDGAIRARSDKLLCVVHLSDESNPPTQHSSPLVQSHIRTRRERWLSRESRSHTASSAASYGTLVGGASCVPAGWTPRGRHVITLSVHQSPVIRLVTLPETLVSVGSDGHVPLWRLAAIDGTTNTPCRPSHSLAVPGSQSSSAECPPRAVTAACACVPLSCVGVGTADGLVSVLDVGAGRVREQFAVTGSQAADPPVITDMCHWHECVVFCSTSHGQAYAYDLRSPVCRPVLTLNNRARSGLITCLCCAHDGLWMVVGTSIGAHVCWDLRFTLPLTTVTHRANSRVRRLLCHPTQTNCVLSAVSGNNELSVCNMETSECEKILCMDNQRHLVAGEKRSSGAHSITAMCAVSGTSCLLTAGTDMCVRRWRLQGQGAASHAAECSLLLTSGLHGDHGVTAARTQVTTGEVGCEHTASPPSPGHVDTISDMGVVGASYWLLATASHDGTVKLWT